jgi:hypothetical protein
MRRGSERRTSASDRIDWGLRQQVGQAMSGNTATSAANLPKTTRERGTPSKAYEIARRRRSSRWRCAAPCRRWILAGRDPRPVRCEAPCSEEAVCTATAWFAAIGRAGRVLSNFINLNFHTVATISPDHSTVYVICLSLWVPFFLSILCRLSQSLCRASLCSETKGESFSELPHPKRLP